MIDDEAVEEVRDDGDDPIAELTNEWSGMGGEGNLPAEQIGHLDGSPVRPPNLARET